MTVVLRKSHGAFSAGTPVLVLDQDRRHKMNLCRINDVEIHVHDNDLITRRECTDVFNHTPKYVRRQRAIAEVKPQSSEETGTIIHF